MTNLDWSRWPNFSKSELACSHCGEAAMNVEFMDKLQELRNRVGRIDVSSGYRCPEYNDKISNTGRDGPHTTGKAADVLAGTAESYDILKEAFDIGFTGIGVSQSGDERFLHLDTLGGHPRPNVWSY